MANPFPLEEMSVEEKLQAMELLWDDLCSKAGEVSSPLWHEAVLTERQALLERGEDRFEDWDAVKRKIRNAVS